jgi:mono/diheme cytochrome c family protein
MIRSVSRRRSIALAAAAACALVTLLGAARAADADALAPHETSASAQVPLDSLAVTQEEYQGWKYFHVYCYRCHGVDALGSDLAPDLRRSVSSLGSVTREVWMTTVKDGRLEKGMPAWKTVLSDEQIAGLYAYVKARSDKRLAAGRPHVKQSE